MEIKKEWIINRCEAMIGEIETEISYLQGRIAQDTQHIEEKEKKNTLSEVELYERLLEEFNDEKEAYLQREDLIASHNEDINRLRGTIETNRLRLIAMMQDKEIYEYYLKHNK